jgi:riboflavin biosynthesis pyrimidine reductase
MKPTVIVHMMSPVDGRLTVDGWSDGGPADRTAVYDDIHDRLGGDAWMCGRVTMTEFVTGDPHPPAAPGTPPRPVHKAPRGDEEYAIGLDRHARLHWAKEDFGEAHFIVLLGHDVSDAHLAELVADGVSYIVAQDERFDVAALLEALHREFGIARILLEGGGGIVGSMMAEGLVDEFSLAVFPAVDGRLGERTIVEAGEDGLGDKVRLTLSHHDLLDGGVMWLRYAVTSLR